MLQCAAERTTQEIPRRYAVGRADFIPPPNRAPALLLQGVGRTVAAGGTIYAQANPAEFIYQVTSGMVRTISVRRDGRRVVHGFHLAGEIFGLERETVHHCSAEAVCESRLVLCPRGRLEGRVSSDVDSARELWSSVLLSRDKTAERFLYLMHGSAFEKLAYFLIDLAWRTRSQGRFDLAMSRYDIADYLGLSSETVSRTFSVFRNRGLIATRGRQVTLFDNRLLRMGEHWADDDEADDHAPPPWPRTFP
ncbi:MAG: helix-turn-helix domain-containing protein [Caulobacteraceae bacterium]